MAIFRGALFLETDDLLNPTNIDSLSLENHTDISIGSNTLPEVTAIAESNIALSSAANTTTAGVFTVGQAGQVSVDFLFDGGKYQGELAIFSLEGMDQFEPGSDAYIQEAARRALSNSELGHIVINDRAEAARFSGELGERDWNRGDYVDVGNKVFKMRVGDQIGLMLVPKGSVQKVFDHPTVTDPGRPLFSMAIANPRSSAANQIADVTGDGHTFVFEDMAIDQGSDQDYNDFVFQISGATGQATTLDQLVTSAQDWRSSGLGQEIVDYGSPEPTLPFVEVEPSQIPILPTIPDQTVIRQRFVETNFDTLPDGDNNSTQLIQLNLFQDTFLNLNLAVNESLSSNTHTVWTGKVDGATYSEVTLVKDLEVDLLVGNIRVDDKAYQIRYQGESVHSIAEVDLTAIPEGGGHLDEDHSTHLHDSSCNCSLCDGTSLNVDFANVLTTNLSNAITGDATADSAVDDGSLIDILVAYTPTMRTQQGGTAAMNSLITLAEAEANQGYQNSGVNQRVRVVHSAEVNYSTSGSSATDVNRLQNADDGFMDEIHTLRDTHSADMVTLITAGSYGGRAYDISIRNANDTAYDVADEAFNVVGRWNILPGRYTFAHELGHLQGSGHNIENAGSASYYPFAYSFGHRDLDDGFRTIMSYDNDTGLTRINYWSNPNLTYNGQPLGTSTANNALSLNNTAIYAANWRHSNDNLSKAQIITGDTVSTTGINVNATGESGETSHADNGGDHSVWWSWTAPNNGQASINTHGSDFDTVLGVYTGDTVNSLTEIASNDDALTGSTSAVTFDAIAGQTYQIAVDGYSGDTGNIDLNLNLNTTPQTSDLSGQFFNVIQEPRNAGNALDIQFDLLNQGAGASGAFDVDFYLSTNDYISTFDRYLGSYRVNNVEGDSSTGTLTKQLFLPSKGDAFWNTQGDDQYAIGMIIDADNEVTETNETNNRNVGEFDDYDTLAINNTSYVDLWGSYFNVVQEPRSAGQSLQTQFRINNSQINDSGTFDVDFYLSTNDYISTFDRHLGSYTVNNVTGNSSSNLLTKTLTLPAKSDTFWSKGDGTYTIGMIVDGDDDISEVNESNNRNRSEWDDYDSLWINNTQNRVSVTINRLRGDFDGFWNSSDFYTRVSFDSNPYNTNNWLKSPTIGGDNDISPNWTFSQSVTGSTVPITIQVFDSDSFLTGKDDHIDIDPGFGRDLNLTYNFNTGQFTGDRFGYRGWQTYSKDGGEIWFTVNHS